MPDLPVVLNLSESGKLRFMSDEREKAKPEQDAKAADTTPSDQPVREIGGPKGPEPTRFGDWERAGRCVDF